MLLIITSNQDFTADFLIVELLKLGLPYFRMNSEELSPLVPTFAVGDHGITSQLSVGGKQVFLADFTSVWYRRAISPPSVVDIRSSEQAFVAGEMGHLFSGLVTNPAIRWVNPIENVRVAEQKLFQLRVAHELGLRVPRTVVSADVDILRQFALTNPNGTVCKPIYHGLFCDGRVWHSVLTRRVHVEELDADAIRLCPVLLQEEILRIADVRATFVGQHLYVADIQGVGEAVDWRDPQLPITYTSSTLPADVESRCREMLAKLGLVYGAFDFIKTPEGDYVFLEVNPTGEWAWLENALGFPIRSALVEVLYGGCVKG